MCILILFSKVYPMLQGIFTCYATPPISLKYLYFDIFLF